MHKFYLGRIAILKIYPDLTMNEFWTSGSDSGCESIYGWCAVNKLFRNNVAKWAPGEPNNRNQSEHCVSIKLDQKSAVLMDSDCSRKLKYICEARDTTKTTSRSHAMLDECGATFNVSRSKYFIIVNRILIRIVIFAVEAEKILNMTIEFTVKIKAWPFYLNGNATINSI
jgi:Lectin C-type domain